MAEKQTSENLRIGAGKPGPGRPKGVPNKATTTIKAAFLEAFERRGGADALVRWAEDNETEFYKLASKLIPTEVNATVQNIPHEDALDALK